MRGFLEIFVALFLQFLLMIFVATHHPYAPKTYAGDHDQAMGYEMIGLEPFGTEAHRTLNRETPLNLPFTGRLLVGWGLLLSLHPLVSAWIV